MAKFQNQKGTTIVSEERLERALQILSGIVAEHGEQHRPLHDLIEAQLEGLRAKARARERVRRLSSAIGQLADAS